MRGFRWAVTAWIALLVLALSTTATRAPAANADADADASCSASHWVASWEAAPSDDDSVADARLDPFVAGQMQTYRVMITPHLGGSTLRIRLSNRFGAAATTIGDVKIADQLAGASVAPGSSTQVLFNGHPAVTIPAGADVESDPLAFSFQAFENLAVSIYASGTDALPTEHFAGRQTSYATVPGAGDQTSDTAATAFTETSTARYFLTGLDVEASAATGAVVTFGDSITDGYQTAGTQTEPEDSATDNLNDRYPDYLQHRLIGAGTALSVANAGISGNKLVGPGQSPVFGPDGLSRFAEDAIDEPGVTTVIILEGINDISDGASTASVIADLTQLVNQAHAAGLRVLLGTLTPDGQYASDGAPGAREEAVREAVNAWIRGQTIANGVIDFDAAVRDPTDPSQPLPAYDDGDGLHFTPAGYEAIADAVPLSDLELPICASARPGALRVAVTPASARSRQQTTVRVTVRAAGSGAPLPGALVDLDARHVRTNPHGAATFALTFTRPGRYRVEITALGYVTRTLSLRVLRARSGRPAPG